MTDKNIQPVYIMPEGSQRTSNREAQRTNILAAKLVAETVRTTLGPKGMDKMLVDSMGDVVVTNDGVTILEEMQIEHPSAKMIVEVAKTQDDEVGDGTTTAVILAGELLKNSEKLLEQNIHPTVIAKGYRLAAEKSQEILESIAEIVNEKDTSLLKKLAMTSITGKGAENAKEKLAEFAMNAVKSIMDVEDSSVIINQEDIKIEKKVGGSIDDAELVKGIIIDKERVNSSMPRFITKAKIALVNSPIEVKNPETDAKISINDPSQMQAFLDMEENMLRKMVDKITSSGANVVVCQKGIDDLAQHFLAQNGIFAVRRVKQSDMDKLARATGAKVVNKIEDLSNDSLGYAGLVEEKRVGDEHMTFIQECKHPKAVTLLVRGGTEHVVEEIKRALDDCIGVVVSALKTKKIVAGAGAPEIELAKQLRKYSESLPGREQLAVQAFADAVDIVPRTLAENAGLDPIDILTELRAAHDKKIKWAGINVFTGKVMDAWQKGVVEPLKIKTQAVSSAAEVAVMILRIDDVIASGNIKDQTPPQMPPGMM